MTSADIMQRLGGRRAVAEFLGESPRAAHKWAARGFPARYWPAIVRMAETKGVDGISLQSLERPMWQRQSEDAA
jgi:hypothetical protein